MRLALVIAPSDPRSGDAAVRREALAWLRGRLSRFGFHVVIVGGVQDPEADIAKATERVAPGDTVLVHASGRLSGRDAIAFGEEGRIGLASLTRALVARTPGHVSFVLELTHEEDANDALLAAEILGEATQALGAKGYGYPVLAAVRPLGMLEDRVAFTRLALPPASEHAGPPPTEALVAGMYDAASATDESHAVAQSFTFVRGGSSLPPPPNASVFERPAHEGYAPSVSPEALEEAVFSSAPPPQMSGEGPSIHSQIAEATEQRDWPRALELRRHRLHLLASPRQKSRELVAIARILQVEMGDAEGTIEALEMARALDPRPLSVLQALRRGYERLGRWGNVIEVTNALAELSDAAERSSLRMACARVAFERLSDVEAARGWLQAAVADDPGNVEAYEALVRLRAALPTEAPPEPPEPQIRQHADESVLPDEPAEERQVSGIDVRPAPAAAFFSEATRVAQAELPSQASPPDDPRPTALRAEAALDALTAPVHFPQSRRPAPAEVNPSDQERSADRLLAEGADEGALGELEALMVREPLRVSAFEKVYAIHRRAGRTDAAYLAALALEELDGADVDQQVLIEQFRTVGPVGVRASIDESAWRAMRAPGSDDVLVALFRAIERAAIAARVDELREQRRLVQLDVGDRLSATSTATIVRSLQWAARVLDVECPHLYLRDDAAAIDALQVREPSIGLGPGAASGRTAKDLAFMAGRHLTYYRPGHQVLLHYPDRDSLTKLLLATVQVAMPKVALHGDDPAVRALRSRLARYLEDDQRMDLDAAVRALDARGGQAALGAWMCGVELTATRAGLLLCGDLATAMAILKSETREAAGVPLDVRRGDLLAFCAGRAHVVTRQQFLTTAPQSMVPPPPPPSSSSLHLSP